ncbi:adenosine deaminase 2 [Drosophila albomicans]|uniref:Adenosine deaminase n=2 Tax=nasuta subgroup TaxID=32307 RepID=A0A6P8X8J3_DROAB|nr:adenosine deaminase 2 [Drosophila albomicans]
MLPQIAKFFGPTNLRNCSPDSYRKLREIICKFEQGAILGNDIQLTDKEIKVNDTIMCLKMDEYNRGVEDPNQFVPGYHIFKRLNDIEKSPLFQLLRKMPKGGALKTHDFSMCSTNFLIDLTYRKHLWACTVNDGCKIVQFLFSKDKPKKMLHEGGKWETMDEIRDRRGEENVRKKLKMLFSMYPLSKIQSNDKAWDHMMGIFALIDGILNYYPIWGEYYYNALKEFNEDGVQYVEVRSLLKRLYCLGGERLPAKETLQVYNDELKNFKADNPDFIDSKIIYSPLRHTTPDKIKGHVKACTKLNKEFPNLLIGFDLVGQETMKYPLKMFVNELLKMPPHIEFYFHAGQTNLYGSPLDENLIDAVLLGTRRIGHAYAITKHPLVMQLAKRFGIAIEVCPICNQVLQLGADYRNHPAATLIANDIPFVLSSGNPSFWRTKPLSHDFYMAFLGIAPRNADLKFLKRTAKNSIRHSALSDEEKANAMQKWKTKWEKWIDWTIENTEKILEKPNE